MSKYVIKRKIPKYQEAGEVTPIMPGNVVGLQGIGVEPLVSSTQIGFDIQQPDINTIVLIILSYTLQTTLEASRKHIILIKSISIFSPQLIWSIQRIYP